MYLNKEKILETADAFTVAEYIGMDFKRIGNRYSILCPGHEQRLGKPDNDFGNCFLNQHGYECYACGVRVNLIDMVMESTGENYAEALGIIGDSCGGREQFFISEIPQKENLPLSKEDLELIGLCSYSKPVYDVINISLQDDENPDYLKQPHYYIDGDEVQKETLLCRKAPSLSLFTLYKEDREAYNSLIIGKASECMENSKQMLDTLSTQQSLPGFLAQALSNEYSIEPSLLLYEMKRFYTNRYLAAKRILASYGIKPEKEQDKKNPVKMFHITSRKQANAPF